MTDMLGREVKAGDVVLVTCRVRSCSQPGDAPWLLLEFIRRAGWHGEGPTVFLPPDAVRACRTCTAAASVGPPPADVPRLDAVWFDDVGRREPAPATAVPDPFVGVPAR